MTNRKLDPEALKRAHGILIEKIEKMERKQHMIGEGDLRFAPAFGLVSSGQNGTAFQNYSVSHETVWGNFDSTRRGMYAALAALESAMERHGITEFESVKELDDLTSEDPKE